MSHELTLPSWSGEHEQPPGPMFSSHLIGMHEHDPLVG